MNPDEIEKLIDEKIREHEKHAGWASGSISVLFALGIIHAIWLIRQWIL